MLIEDNENLGNKQELVKEDTGSTNLPIEDKKEQPVYEDKGGGRALNAFSKLFFILTIIGTALTAVMVFLPIFLAILGVLSTLVWFLAIVVVSVFTIGLIWTNEDFKSFNTGWMDLNSKLFNSSNSLNEFVNKVVPPILIAGGVVIIISWLFTILGAIFDKFRIKKYKGRIIGLAIITAIYIAFLIINIVIRNKQ